jgi:hypothetical protein
MRNRIIVGLRHTPPRCGAILRLVTYINGVHVLADVYDGFLVHSRSSGGAALSDPPYGTIPVPGVIMLRDDLRAPVLNFQTETDVMLFGSYAARQDDSASFRLWEVAGTAHADTYTVAVGREDRGDSPDAFKLIETAEPLPGVLTCNSLINSGPQHVVLKAAIAALNGWVRDGTPPPSAPRLDVLPGPPFALQIDEVGNARGGIRTPPLDVPLATVTGLPQSGVPLCALFGTTVPFDDVTLAQRYGTPVDYRAAFDLATDAAVDAGYVRPADALLMKAAAQDVDFGG